MEKLAENLQKMGEDDLLRVVEMIHDNKSADSWTKNDVEREIFIAICDEAEKANASRQKANSKSISTPCPTASSACFGTTPSNTFLAHDKHHSINPRYQWYS